MTMEAIDARTGEPTWTDRSFDGVLGAPQGGGDVFIGPAISSGGSYLGTATLAADSGEPISIQPGFLIGNNPPQVITDRSMVFAFFSQLYAYGVRTPGHQWTIDAPDGVTFGLPTVAGSTLYVVATDATGSTLETYDVRTGTALDHVPVAAPGRPIIANGRLFLVTDGISDVYVYDLS